MSKSTLLCLLLFLFSFILRLFLINQDPYSIDCLSFVLRGEKLLETGTLDPHFGIGYPLTIILSALFIFLGKLFGVTDAVLSVNFMSVFFSALSIPFFYYFVQELFDDASAFYATLLYSVCPIILGNSVYGSSHSPELFFLFAGLYLLISFLKYHHSQRLLLSALAFGCMGATRLQDLVLFFIPLCYFFFTYTATKDSNVVNNIKTRFRPFISFVLCMAIIALFFHLPYLFHDRQYYFSQLKEFRSASLVGSDPIIWSGVFFNLMYLFQTLSILGILMAFTGLVLMALKRPHIFIFFALWILIPLVLFINMYTTIPRHQIFMLAPFIIAEVYVLVGLMRIKRVFSSVAFFIYVLILLFTFGHYYPAFYHFHHNPYLKKYCLWLNEVTEENARIIATDFSHFIIYYSDRAPQGRPLKDRTVHTDEELENFKREIIALLNNDIPIYILDSGLYAYDEEKKFSNFMINNFELEYVDKRLYRDWHRGYLQTGLFYNWLYRIKEKNEAL